MDCVREQICINWLDRNADVLVIRRQIYCTQGSLVAVENCLLYVSIAFTKLC